MNDGSKCVGRLLFVCNIKKNQQSIKKVARAFTNNIAKQKADQGLKQICVVLYVSDLTFLVILV